MDADCPVCFEPLASQLRVVAPCTHTVCYACFQRLPAPQTCPMCRADLAPLLPPPPPASPEEVRRSLMERILLAESLRADVLPAGAITIRRAPLLRDVVLRRSSAAYVEAAEEAA